MIHHVHRCNTMEHAVKESSQVYSIPIDTKDTHGPLMEVLPLGEFSRQNVQYFSEKLHNAGS